jgi:hypothetical protein
VAKSRSGFFLSADDAVFLFARITMASSTSPMLMFEWDANKARANLAKHAISFPEATTVFGDAASLTIPDFAHSHSESRFIILGRSHRERKHYEETSR